MDFQYLLVIAGSGRMLAQSVRKAGLKALVIDLYADLDTRCHAHAYLQVPSLAKEHLAPAVEFFIQHYPVAHLIYGSGFEYHPESLDYLDKRLTLLGNSPETFKRLQNKADFFTTLGSLNIAYPETVFTEPDAGEDWLVKPLQGQGGVGIKRHHRQLGYAFMPLRVSRTLKPIPIISAAMEKVRDAYPTTTQTVYWQKYQQGKAHSVLFLADGQRFEVIGFNTQWTVKLGESEAFLFAGIINHADLTAACKDTLTQWLSRIVPAFKLKGLNSLDFMQQGDSSRVLEINPRLSAGMQLYDGDLLSAHIDASRGEMRQVNGMQSVYTAYQIVYAEQDVVIPDAFEWPEGCVDLPATGVLCRKTQPICSMIARHKTPQAVFKQLQLKQQALLKQLQTGSSSWNTKPA